jgi:hypothetical protein
MILTTSKRKCFLSFTHPDSSDDESSLSTRREGEEGESIYSHSITCIKMNK